MGDFYPSRNFKSRAQFKIHREDSKSAIHFPKGELALMPCMIIVIDYDIIYT